MCTSREDVADVKKGSSRESQRAAVEARLARRGYLDRGRLPPSTKEFAPRLPAVTTVSAAIRKLQSRYNLRETGKINAELMAFLDQPYCDVPDPPGPAAMVSGGVPWRDPHVTFQYMTWPTALTRADVRGALRVAFDTWEAVCAVRFSEVTTQGDMRIVFAAGAHGDGWPFDGPGHILAHAFYPDWADNLRGDLHIDTSEPWVIDAQAPLDARDLVTTAIHEVGHSIGLPHSNVPESVMWPNYTGPQRTLHRSDIDLAQSLYPES